MRTCLCEEGEDQGVVVGCQVNVESDCIAAQPKDFIQ